MNLLFASSIALKDIKETEIDKTVKKIAKQRGFPDKIKIPAVKLYKKWHSLYKQESKTNSKNNSNN